MIEVLGQNQTKNPKLKLERRLGRSQAASPRKNEKRMVFIELSRVSATLGQHKVDRSILDSINRRRGKIARST